MPRMHCEGGCLEYTETEKFICQYGHVHFCCPDCGKALEETAKTV